MSSIRICTRTDGSFYTQVLYRHQGRQSSQSFDAHDEALRWQKVLDRVGPAKALEVLALQAAASAESVMTIRSAGHKYIDGLTGIEEGTRKRYRRFMANDIEPYFGADLPAIAIGDTAVGGWINWLEHEVGNAPKTIANKHGFLFALMAWLVKKNVVPANPCAETRLPRVDPAEMTFLERDEFAALLAVFPERWRRLVLFLVVSGTRWGEATALRVRDVNRKTATVRVCRAWKYTGGKRVLGKPKTKRSTRTVDLDPALLPILELDGRGRDEWLFANENGDPIHITTFYKQVWVRALDLLNADPADPLHGKRPRIHDLRHTCASWMIGSSVPLPVIQAHLGHESIKTTIDRYGHLDRTAGAAAARAISANLPIDLTRSAGELESTSSARPRLLKLPAPQTLTPARRELVLAGQLGEIAQVDEGFEAVWMDAHGEVHSQVFGDYSDAVDHIAVHEAEPSTAAA